MPELAVQPQLGPYLLLREAGQGGMAIVFEALDTRSEQIVAVKLLKTPLLTPERQAEMVARLGREAQILARLSHPGIVTLREGPRRQDSPSNGLHYIVLEYLDGATLRSWLTRGPLSPDQTLYLLEQIAEALDALHDAGFVYCDLKPSNVMLLRDGGVKLIDFGTARQTAAWEPIRDTNPAETFVGSPADVAPERIAGRPGGPASDIWSLGVLLYEMLTGSLPFLGETRAEVLQQIASAPPAPLPPASIKIERVMRRALEKDPDRRYPSACAMVSDYALAIGVSTRWALEGMPEKSTPSPAKRRPPPPDPLRRVRRVLAGTAIACSIGLALTGLVSLWALHRPHRARFVSESAALPPPSLPRPRVDLSRPRVDVSTPPVRVRVAAARQERRRPEAVLIAPRAPKSRGTGEKRVFPPAERTAAVRPKDHRPARSVAPLRVARAVTAPVLPPIPRPQIVPQPRVKIAPAYTLTALGPLGDGVHGLNDHGQSVGGLDGYAVLWHDGTLRRLDSPVAQTKLTPYSEAAAINNEGQVVGFSHFHAFLWQDGQMTDLGTLVGRQSNAAALNDQGMVVGTSHNHAVLWQNGQIKDLGTLGGEESHARAVNNRGQIAGVSYTPTGYYHAFLWQDGAMQDLGTLGGPSSMAVAINDQGQVAGLSVTASGATHAFLWQDGRMTDLGTLSGDSQALGIGPRGEVVGASAGHAVLWRDGDIQDLNRLVGPDFDGTLLRAVAVNAQGQVLCYGHRRGGSATQAFLLTPNAERSASRAIDISPPPR